MSHIEANLRRFTYDAYAQLIEHLQSKYSLISAKDYDPKSDKPTVVLRHDVDWDLESALHMARLENDYGVKSTFLVLLSCPTYNLHSDYGIDAVTELLSLGHEIGLHYDVSVYNKLDTNLSACLLKEVDVLERMIRKPVLSVACHNSSTLTTDPIWHVHPNNLSDFSNFDLYVHDANRTWTTEYLKPLIEMKYNRNMLNTHPCLWSHEYVADRYEWITRCMSRIERKWINLWREKDDRTK